MFVHHSMRAAGARRKKLLIALLALGTVAGYGWGFHSLRHCRYERRQAFERHVAEVCVDAARR